MSAKDKSGDKPKGAGAPAPGGAADPGLEKRLREMSQEDQTQSITDPPDVRSPDNAAISGASFDTPEGRAAQGMKPDVGGGEGGQNEADPNDPTQPGDTRAHDADSGGGAGRGTPGAGTEMRGKSDSRGGKNDSRTGGSFDDREPADANQKNLPPKAGPAVAKPKDPGNSKIKAP
jgi:hypothetical protein